MCSQGLVVCECEIASFEIAHLDRFVLFLFLLDVADVQSRVGLLHVLGEDVHDFAALEILPTSLVEHVLAVEVVLWVAQVGKNACWLPCTEERFEDEGTNAGIALHRIDVIQGMAIQVATLVFGYEPSPSCFHTYEDRPTTAPRSGFHSEGP